MKLLFYRLKWALECLIRTPDEMREMCEEIEAVFEGRM